LHASSAGVATDSRGLPDFGVLRGSLNHAALPDRFHELSVAELRGERHSPSPAKSLTETGEHRQIRVECDTLQPTNPEWRESVVVLQIAERTLDCRAATVEVAEAVRVSRDAGEEPTAESERKGDLLPADAAKGDHRLPTSKWAERTGS
jgi:hypothetical protein